MNGHGIFDTHGDEEPCSTVKCGNSIVDALYLRPAFSERNMHPARYDGGAAMVSNRSVGWSVGRSIGPSLSRRVQPAGKVRLRSCLWRPQSTLVVFHAKVREAFRTGRAALSRLPAGVLLQ